MFSKLATTSGGDPLFISLTEVAMTGLVGPTGFGSPIEMTGEISIDDLVQALVELAGADEAGALETLAGILEFDAADPPATVPVEAEFSVRPVEG